MRISDAAAAAGCSPRMVRYYHRTGALPEPPRSSNGYRDYMVDDVARLIRLTTLTDTGVPAAAVDSVTDHRDLLKDALLAVDSRIEELHQQRSRILSLLTGTRSFPPDVTDLLDDLRQWTMDREPDDRAVVALLDRDIRALQLMVDTDMTTEDTWTLLRSTLLSVQARENSLAGHRAWNLLSDTTPADPDIPDLIARCSRGQKDGIFSGLTETLRPGTLPPVRRGHTVDRSTVCGTARTAGGGHPVTLLLKHPGIRLLLSELRLWQDLFLLCWGRTVVPAGSAPLTATQELWFLPGALTAVTAVEVTAVELLVPSAVVRLAVTVVSVYSLLLLWAVFGRRRVYPSFVDDWSLVLRQGRAVLAEIPRNSIAEVTVDRTFRADRATVDDTILVLGNGAGTTLRIRLNDRTVVTDPDRWPWQKGQNVDITEILMWVDDPAGSVAVLRRP